MASIYETTNHYYTVNVQVSSCSKCGQRTVQLRASGNASVCDGCAAAHVEVAVSEQELAYSPRLHQHLQSRWFGQAR